MTQFIAEISSNHNGDLQRCFQFIDSAADIGCDAVKFQLFKIKELFAPDILNLKPELQRRVEWELPISFIPELSRYCKYRNIQFGCTPFYLDAVKELLPYVDFFKIASYELLWHDLILSCGNTGKPVILSTGMATLNEVSDAVLILQKSGCEQITLLHCTSEYPTLPEHCNLSAIETLRNTFHCHVGWSDHSVSAAVVYRAVHHFNASIIEFHFDLEGKGEEFKSGHCWLPNNIQKVIENVNKGFIADGSPEKKPDPIELIEREWRADPKDGLRPLLSTRKLLRKNE